MFKGKLASFQVNIAELAVNPQFFPKHPSFFVKLGKSCPESEGELGKKLSPSYPHKSHLRVSIVMHVTPKMLV